MKNTLIATTICSAIFMSGCNVQEKINEGTKKVQTSIENKTHDTFEKTKDIFNRNTASVNISKGEKELASIPFDYNKYPDNYVKVGNGKVTLTAQDKTLLATKGKNRAWQSYSHLDVLGRGQKGVALVDYKTVLQHSRAYMKQNGLIYGDKKIYERPSFPSYVHVSGEYKDGRFDVRKQTWKGQDTNNAGVNGKSDWLYNKSHTIAWSLGGDMETHNVTLGTRAQNVGKNDGKGGMGLPETAIRDAVYSKKDTKVFYEVTPIYKSNELVPRGSHVRAYSINDNGKTVNMNIWVFNAQKDITINYKDGTWQKR